MSSEKVGWNVPEGTKALVKAIAASLPVDWTEADIVARAICDFTRDLLSGNPRLTAEERAFLETRLRPVEKALQDQDTGELEVIRSPYPAEPEERSQASSKTVSASQRDELGLKIGTISERAVRLILEAGEEGISWDDLLHQLVDEFDKPALRSSTTVPLALGDVQQDPAVSQYPLARNLPIQGWGERRLKGTKLRLTREDYERAVKQYQARLEGRV